MTTDPNRPTEPSPCEKWGHVWVGIPADGYTTAFHCTRCDAFSDSTDGLYTMTVEPSPSPSKEALELADEIRSPMWDRVNAARLIDRFAAAQVEQAIAVLDDEEASHQDTLRLWREANAQLARAERVVEETRKLLERGCYLKGTARWLSEALIAYDTANLSAASREREDDS